MNNRVQFFLSFRLFLTRLATERTTESSRRPFIRTGHRTKKAKVANEARTLASKKENTEQITRKLKNSKRTCCEKKGKFKKCTERSNARK